MFNDNQAISSISSNLRNAQLEPEEAAKKPNEENIASEELIAKKKQAVLGQQLETMFSVARKDSATALEQQMDANSQDNYNRIDEKSEKSLVDSGLDMQTIANVRASLVNPEAEATSNAATLMLVFIALMGNFQRAKANAIISNLDSILAKMSKRIDEMTNEKDQAYNRDMVSFGGELCTGVMSLGVSIASAKTVEATRSKLLTEQENLSKAYELSALQNFTKNSNKDSAGYNSAQQKIKVIENHFERIGFDESQSIQPEVFRAKVENHQTEIARTEARLQLSNNVATLSKSLFSCVSAMLNRDTSTKKIAGEQAELAKEKLNRDVQQESENLSVAREACMKLLAVLEKMLEAQAENTRAIARHA